MMIIGIGGWKPWNWVQERVGAGPLKLSPNRCQLEEHRGKKRIEGGVTDHAMCFRSQAFGPWAQIEYMNTYNLKEIEVIGTTKKHFHGELQSQRLTFRKSVYRRSQHHRVFPDLSSCSHVPYPPLDCVTDFCSWYEDVVFQSFTDSSSAFPPSPHLTHDVHHVHSFSLWFTDSHLSTSS